VTDSQKAAGTVLAVSAAPSRVSVALQGAVVDARYPVWYSPQVGDVVVIDWLGSQPFVASTFAP